MNLVNAVCGPGQVRQVGQHKLIHERSQTDHMPPVGLHEEANPEPRASGVKVLTYCTSWSAHTTKMQT